MNYPPGGAFGPNPISRAAAPNPQLPSSQGFIGTGGDMFRPIPKFVVPGPPLTHVYEPPGYGIQFAPGQGGDTPGGGGNFMGMGQPVETLWITDGVVTPQAIQHVPGTVGFVGSRRSKA